MRAKWRTAVALVTVTASGLIASGASAATTQPLPQLPSVSIGMTVQSGASLGSGLIFVDPHQLIEQATTGPEIIDNQGRLVWYDPLPDAVSASNFQVQEYKGRPVLTWWQGTGDNPAFGAFAPGIGQGEGVIMNDHYEIIKVIGAINGVTPDTHEFQLTPQGDALITGYDTVPNVDLTSVGGPANGTVIDSLVREINVRTGKVLLNWSALAHVPITDSYALPLLGSSPWDFFHINSISLAPNGNILISSRHMWALYEIDPSTGATVWTLGGKQSDFTMGPGASFAWQHQPRFVGPDEIQLFDDEAGTPFAPTGQPSRAIWLHLNLATHTATLVRQIVQPSNQPVTGSQGSVQTLSNGNTLIGWGSAGTFSEYDPAGNLLLEGQLPTGGTPVTLPNGQSIPNTWSTYRVFRDQWTGTPTTPPAISVTSTGENQWSVSAAWNGDTQVTTWTVLGGPDRQHMRPITSAPWNGLITTIPTTADVRFLRVEAVGSNNQPLAESSVIPVNG